MPEGDTIHKHALDFQARFVGRRLERLLRGGVAEPRCAGATLTAAEAHGKHLLLSLARGEEQPLEARVHLGIAGKWRIGETARFSLTQRAAAPLCLEFGGEVAFVYHPLEVTLRLAALADHRPIAALGPDLLDPACDLDEVLRRAREPRHAARPLGELLLDQRVAAGIGNVYKSEVCFLEALHPFLRVDEVDDAALRRVYERARTLLGQNVGPWPRTTTADRSRGALPRPGEGRYHVYGQRRRPCPRCRTPIEWKQMGPDLRPTFFCPRCQAP